MTKLTGRTALGVPLSFNDKLHVVVVADTSQDPLGSSYEGSFADVFSLIYANLFISDTFVNIDTAATAGLLFPGAKYEIIDQVGGNLGLSGSPFEHSFTIVLTAVTSSTFAVEGIMKANYINRLGSPRDVAEDDIIGYNMIAGSNTFANVLWRKDRRENIISNQNTGGGLFAIALFQWGNDNVVDNICHETCAFALVFSGSENQGIIKSNRIVGVNSFTTAYNTIAGLDFSGNTIESSQCNIAGSTGTIQYNRVYKGGIASLDANTGTITNNYIGPVSSLICTGQSGLVDSNILETHSNVQLQNNTNNYTFNRLYNNSNMDASDNTGSFVNNILDNGFFGAPRNSGTIQFNQVFTSGVFIPDNSNSIAWNEIKEQSGLDVETNTGTVNYNKMFKRSNLNANIQGGDISFNALLNQGTLTAASQVSTGIINGLTLESNADIDCTGNAGTIDNTEFSPFTLDGFILTINMAAGKTFSTNKVGFVSSNITFPGGVDIINKRLDKGFSSLEDTIDITGASSIPIAAGYQAHCGVIHLTSTNAGEDINAIAGVIPGFDIGFFPTAGITTLELDLTPVSTPIAADQVADNTSATGNPFIANGANGDSFVVRKIMGESFSRFVKANIYS